MSGWGRGLVEVRPSTVHGQGVFAMVDIAKGTTWWAADIADTITITRAQFAALKTSAPSPTSDALIEAIQEYSFYVEALDLMILITDNGRYVNHGDDPNSAAVVDGTRFSSATTRDIAAGEELFEDYATYDWCPWPGIAPEFHVVNTVSEPARVPGR